MEKVCRQCGDRYTVTTEDLEFYRAIAPVIAGNCFELPPPSLCPLDRERRRLSFRNIRNLHWRNCDLTGDKILSVYPPGVNRTVYHSGAWFSDRWDPLQYGAEFDFSRPFFEQFGRLLAAVPVINHYVILSENCEYINGAANCRDCYLSFCMDHCEECFYVAYCKSAISSFDSYRIESSELCYECIDCENCYNLRYSIRCVGCSDSYFLSDCRQCQNCIGCANLINKEYYIFNEKKSPEEFVRMSAELRSRKVTEEVKRRTETLSKDSPKKYYFGHSNEGFSGNNVHHLKNSYGIFDARNLEESRYCNYVFDAHHCVDLSIFGEGCQWIYECHSTGPNCANNLFCMFCWSGSQNNLYCHLVSAVSNCFGCSGLKHKEYCILNRQYTKAEYEALVPKIIAHMQAHGEWGEFFPSELTCFAYNESHAFDYHPLTEEEALKRGFRWKEFPPNRPFSGSLSLPDKIDDVDEGFLKKPLVCADCSRNFRVVPQEFKFYSDSGIPLPGHCPECRYQRRKALATGYTLFERECDSCGVELQSAFDPAKEPAIYCEECYLKEVF